MKRDMDLVRSILMELEDIPYDGGHHELELVGDMYTADEVSYHVMLLDEAGLIRAFNLSTQEAEQWFPGHITWQGHEFLEAARDEARWAKAKALVKNKGGAMVFDVIKSVLIETIKHQVASP